LEEKKNEAANRELVEETYGDVRQAARYDLDEELKPSASMPTSKLR